MVSDTLGAFAKDVAAALATRTQDAADLVAEAANLQASSDDWKWLLPRFVADTLEQSPTHTAIVDELRSVANAAKPGLLVPHTRASYLLRAAPPVNDPHTLASILSLASRERAAATPNTTLLKARTPMPAPTKQPWQAGYEAAIDLRDQLGWGDDPAPPLKSFLLREGVEVVEQPMHTSISGGTARSRRSRGAGAARKNHTQCGS